MIEIYDRKSLETFVKSGHYPPDFCLYLTKRIGFLREVLLDAGMSREETVSLKEYGYPVILESSDDLRKLDEIGLHSSQNGLFGTVPEAIERICFKTIRVFCISVAFNNSFMLEFMLPDNASSRRYQELPGYLARWDCQDVIFSSGRQIRKNAA